MQVSGIGVGWLPRGARPPWGDRSCAGECQAEAAKQQPLWIVQLSRNERGSQGGPEICARASTVLPASTHAGYHALGRIESRGGAVMAMDPVVVNDQPLFLNNLFANGVPPGGEGGQVQSGQSFRDQPDLRMVGRDPNNFLALLPRSVLMNRGSGKRRQYHYFPRERWLWRWSLESMWAAPMLTGCC